MLAGRSRVILVVAVAVGALAACSSPGTGGSAASITLAAAAASPSPGGAAEATAFCSFLGEGLAEWEAIGKADARARYRRAFVGWTQRRGIEVTPKVGQQMDAGAKQTCPKVRAAVLAALGWPKLPTVT